jgi:nicotinate-nucleotide pyrophosphorylase (carboxylating)
MITISRKRNMNTIQLPEEYLNTVTGMALEEDAGRGDITSELLIPCELQGRAYLLVKASGIIAGTEVVKKVMWKVDRSLRIETRIPDGTRVESGDVVMLFFGNVRSILKAERVALNFIQRLSGIATTTASYVEKVRDLGVDIADTRKTTPILRLLEKYSVKMGGGRNHRMDLNDAILIKDNHFAALRALGMSYKEIVAKARQGAPVGMKVEAEARTVEEAVDALEAGVDIIMLDNMDIRDMTRAVELVAGQAEVEASGGVNLETVHAIAETGVDYISVGALTHSYNSLDISLELESQTFKLV